MKTAATILMLEDDHDDRFITVSTLQELGYDLPIVFLSSSSDLFNELKKVQPPVLLVMDYNSSPENALQVLKRIKTDIIYRKIPVIVLGESATAPYVEECYAAGASSFITKPASDGLTREKISTFFRYWLDVAELS